MKILIDGQTLSVPEIERGIGVVFKRLCEQFVVNDLSKEWFISVRDLSDLGHITRAAQKRLHPIIINESQSSGTYMERTVKYSEALQEVVNGETIDAYWNPNPLMMNVVLPTELKDVLIFATIFDIIPMLMKEEYFNHWSKEAQDEYKRRLKALPVWADRLIFISESAKNDFQRLDSRVAAKSVAIPIAVDHTKFWPYAVEKNKFDEHYVLFVGGFDSRKNMDRALEAFSRLVKEYSKEYLQLKFYVICSYTPEEKTRYEGLAESLGVLDRLVLTGHVGNKRLAMLYRGASVFFFPSRYEGFGLPVLEAMACGLPIVTTNVSSLPEVAGNLAYYCSADETTDMARALREALCEGKVDLNRRRKAINRAKEFTWAKTAVNYSKVFTKTLLNARTIDIKRRLSIAYVTPWPPQRTGIADYSYQLVRHLKKYADIVLYLIDGMEKSSDYYDLPVRQLSSLPQNKGEFDSIIYHVGNNTNFHKEIYKAAWNYPGIVVLHDINIHSFLFEAFFSSREESFYEEALTKGYGNEGRSYFEEIIKKQCYPDIWKFPMSHALVKRSLGTIVHSHWAKQQFKGVENIFVIPVGAVINKTDIDPNSEKKLRARFRIDSDKFLISTFGFVNSLKRIPQILEAVGILIARGYPLQFLIGGDLIDPGIKVKEICKSLGLENDVIITGYLDGKEFDYLVTLSDIIINLRCPSMGESSATLMKAFAYGKPCIVSNYQQFAEFSNSVCWKADVDETEVPQLVAYLEALMRNPSALKQLGKNAAFFVENYSSYDLAAKLYLDVVAKIIRRGSHLKY